MIPLYLSLSGFLSYRQPVELDFNSFELGCIAGANGAGKSSLLDAITWVLFGQARKRDDSLINAQSGAAEVCLIFAYEGNVYRVLRVKPRDKTAMLEFHILQAPQEGNGHFDPRSSKGWKPLTERSLRDTEARIQQVLRLDYETFVNAAFFLQGKADQFTQQRPGDRKRILGSILGLEVWETYRQRALERRRAVEAEITGLDGRLHEIAAELGEERERRQRLAELEGDLERLSKERDLQETSLENVRKIAATLAEQGRLVDALRRQWESASRQLNEIALRVGLRRQERETFTEILSRAGQVQGAYATWQATRAELERLDRVAEQFRQQEKRREGPRDEIHAARARLEEELRSLQARQGQMAALQSELFDLQARRATVQAGVAQSEGQLAQREQLEADLQLARQRQAEAKAENPRLKAEMDELKERIDQLAHAEGAGCPLCGQPLGPEDRESLVNTLTMRGKEMGDRYRANQILLRESDNLVRDLELQIRSLGRVEIELRAQHSHLAQLASRCELLEAQLAEWQTVGAPRRQEIEAALAQGIYAPEAQARLAEIDAELKAIGYDAAAHDALRRVEAEGRASENDLRTLERAQATLAPLERELADLEGQFNSQQAEVDRQQQEFQTASTALAAAQAQAPDLLAAEQALFSLEEQENRLRLEVGAARQKVLILDDLRNRRKSLEAQREALARQAAQFKQLERAFSKDGVPALLIEQALPEIESRANEILDRLSASSMTVRFVTQSAYKDKRREDLKETLDIQISDGAGTRDYEMFSGGEAFRANFAIRLALSEVLAQRAGARLQTLVIDEGFGSQDALGRQRLIEAINLVRPDFAKILVITHIDELKDAFPTRIEVEKTDQGSIVRVV